MFQFPSPNKLGECTPPFTVPSSARGKPVQLPEIYTTVPAVATAHSSTAVPEVEVEQTNVFLDKALEAEDKWVQNSTLLLKKEQVEKEDAIAWAAYHASQSKNEYTWASSLVCNATPLL